MMFCLAVLVILAYDVWKAFWFTDPATGASAFGIGVGTLLLATNVALLSGYLFGCHSMRHVVGGCVDQLSQAPMGVKAYSCVSCLNRKHMVWAWCSLTVGFVTCTSVVFHGRVAGHPNLVMPEHQTHEHDVLVMAQAARGPGRLSRPHRRRRSVSSANPSPGRRTR
jgi:hypothetical protein